MFFDSWQGIARVLVVGVLAYVAIVLLLRVSGNRTLSKLNAFDFVVTIALGSTLSSVLLSKDVALVEGVVAFALLVGLQFVVTWASVRSSRVSKLVTSEPVLLVSRGAYLEAAMRRARVKKDEIAAALRQNGVHSLDQVDAVILESDGTLSVLRAARTAGPP
jgi:uncharacterized membrane protein YcaP (DUF421 family)